MSDSDFDELDELEGLDIDDIEAELEAIDYFQDPNCFSKLPPELEWQWDQLEELSGDKIAYSCHFPFKHNGLYIPEQTKLKEVDLSAASCKFDHLLDFLQMLLTTSQNQVETLRLPAFEETKHFAELFVILKDFPSLTTLDLSHCIHADLVAFETELFTQWRDLSKLTEVLLSNKPRGASDFDAFKSIATTVPYRIKTLGLGATTTIPDFVWDKIKSISKVLVQHLESSTFRPPARFTGKLEHNPPAQVASNESDALQGKDEELTRDEVFANWDLSSLKPFTEKLEKNIHVAILGSGLHVCHTNLTKKVRAFRSFSSGELAQSDSTGRTTHAAGVISMLAGNRCEFLIGKVNSSCANSLVQAIQWATNEHVDVIFVPESVQGANSSLHELYLAINSALAAGIVVICSATSVTGKHPATNIGYPAKLGNVICVAGHLANGDVFEGAPNAREIEFLAPGERVWSMGVRKKYEQMSGASVAGAHVVGLVALLLAFDRTHQKKIQNCEQVKQILRNLSASPDQHSSYSGYGKLIPSKWFQSGFSEEKISSSFYTALANAFEY